MKRLLFDGSMGALLISKGLGGDSASLNVENYEIIRDIHSSYIDAGANIIITNTFSLTAKKEHRRYALEETINGALKAATEAVAGKEAYIAFDIGPSGLDMAPLGDSEYDDAYGFYKEVLTIADDRFDYILIETFTNIEELKAAIDAAKKYSAKPVFVSMSFNEKGYTMFGVSVEEFTALANEKKVYAAGVNCNLLPGDMLGVAVKIKSLLDKDILSFAQPNRGSPKVADGILAYEMSDEEYATGTLELLRNGIDILGGCCGSNENCIKLIREGMDKNA